LTKWNAAGTVCPVTPHPTFEVLHPVGIDRPPESDFAAAAAAVADRFDDEVERRGIESLNGWRVLIGLAHPGKEAVGRIVGFLVVPADTANIAPGGLSHRQLRDAITGLADLGADVDLERWHRVFERTGTEGSPQRERDLKRELRRLGAKQPGGRGAPYDEAFYARVAWDAIELAEKGRGSAVVNALLGRYEKSDPRPKQRRGRPITYATVKGWHEKAKDLGFLPRPGRKGVRVTAATERLVAFTRGREDDGRT
jgi:hypothetical protein